MMHWGKWLALKNLSVILVAEQMQITQNRKLKKKKFANCTHLMVMAFITICNNSVLNRQHPQFHITMSSLSNIAIDNIIIFS